MKLIFIITLAFHFADLNDLKNQYTHIHKQSKSFPMIFVTFMNEQKLTK